MIFGGEAEGVFEVEVTGGDGRGADGTGDSAKGGVIVVSSDAITGFKVDEFRDVLVPVKGVEELVASGIGEHEERTCSHGFGWIPNEEIHLRIVVQRVQLLHAEVVIVDKAVVLSYLSIHLFLVEDATAHKIEIHDYNASPKCVNKKAIIFNNELRPSKFSAVNV